MNMKAVPSYRCERYLSPQGLYYTTVSSGPSVPQEIEEPQFEDYYSKVNSSC